MSTIGSIHQQVTDEGFAGPIPILAPHECQETLARLIDGPGAAVWKKGRSLAHPDFHRLATRDDVLDHVKAVLGPDVLLWGTRLVHKRPGVEHPWHTDIECCGDEGRSLTVWLAIDGADRASSLQVLARSHRYGVTLQEVAARAGKRRTEVTTEDALGWALERDPGSRVEAFDVRDGDALLFDGRLWHYSHNTSGASRTAVLLQYCTPDSRIRMPLDKNFDWPFRLSEERTPCILVSGADRHGVNRIVPAPPEVEARPCVVRSLRDVQFKQKTEGWRSGRVFRRSTPVLSKLWSHMSVLEAGAIPHEPHRHEDEELLIVLEGAVDIIRENSTTGERVPERLGPGAFVYHPAFQSHTLRSAGPGPATYLMFKWIGDRRTDREGVLRSGTYDMWTGTEKVKAGWKRVRICQSPTEYLRRLNVHLSVMEPGAGYAPHADPYEVAVLVLSGAVETLDRRVEAPSVIFYPAGALHGLRNPAADQAVYLVVEFHAN